VIPDSYRSNFRPFYLQPPDAFLSFCSLHLPGIGRGIVAPLHGTVSGLGFATGQAGSPMHLAESSSTLLCLWTGLSLPVALHPASQRRSYLQLRTGQCSRPEGTFTLLLVRTFRRTRSQALRARLPSHRPSGTFRNRLVQLFRRYGDASGQDPRQTSGSPQLDRIRHRNSEREYLASFFLRFRG
jgi:hypothetical protein